MFQQIHAWNQEPLTKVQRQLDDSGKQGNVYVFVQQDSSGKNEKKILLGQVDYKQFVFETKVDNGVLELYLNTKQVLKTDEILPFGKNMEIISKLETISSLTVVINMPLCI